MRLLTRALPLWILLCALAVPAQAKKPSRFGTILSAARLHTQLRRSHVSVNMAKSKILSDQTAAAKKYGDSWTCRSSTTLLLGRMTGRSMTMTSVGKKAFHWGNEGWVDYHYYAVDNPRRPTLLLDPTACTNFARDAGPGGMLRGLLEQAGQRRGTPEAARRVTRRVASGGLNGLLVLTKPADIAVYQDALEQAAQRQAQVRRNAERR